MKLWLAVAVGGGLGATARYAVSLLALRLLGAAWPWGTLLVNVVGSFVLGAVLAWCARDPRVPKEVPALLGTGFCGGLTTFSTFAVETWRLDPGAALLNVALNVGGAVGAAALGAWLVQRG